MDKNKILDAAAKLVARGAYDKAIKEYQKVLDVDPKDVRVLHKLGELYEKKNDNLQAAGFFTRVADGYASDGFSMKAIALYKKVLKLDPNLIEVNLRLAELHQQHQLMSEAMAYYQTVANHYDKSGNVRASLDILKKMVDLEPDNVASRIKLADLYAREQMNAEAGQEYKRAAEYLKRNNRVDDYLRVAERLSALEPGNLELSRDLAQEYLDRGDQKRALAKLQVCFKADPRDVQTLNLLAQAFLGLGQTSKTLSVYKELAKVYTETHRAEEASRIWAKIAALDPEDPDVQARSAPRPQPAAPAAPAQAQAQPSRSSDAAVAEAAAPEAGGAGLSREQLAKLLTETDVYVKYGLHDKALEHLRRVFAVDPENLDAHEKAYHIYVAANNGQAAGEQLLNVLRLCTRAQDVQRAQPYLATILQQNPSHPEVPAFLAVLRTESVRAPAPAVEEPVAEDAILVDSSDEEIIVADAPEDALAPEQDLALSAAPQSSDEVISDEVMEEPAFDADYGPVAEDEPLGVASDFDEPIALVEPTSAEIVIEEPAFEDEEPTVETAIAPPPPPPAAPRRVGKEVTRAGVKAPVPEPVAAPEPELAEPELAEPELAEPELAEPELAEPELAEPEPVVVEEDFDDTPAGEVEATQVARAEEVYEQPVEAPPEEEPAGEECDEAAFFLDQGLSDEAREILETVLIAFPGHARAKELMARLEQVEAGAGPAPVEAALPQVQPVQEEGRDAFDLAAELADELGDLGAEDTAAPAGGDDYQVSVDEVFSEFKKGLEKIVKPEDVDTHYDLGIAYREMGLYDDAIGEFTVARQGCVGKKKEIDCLTMIGLIQVQKGDGQEAVQAFKQALQSEFAAGDTGKALRFELAAAWEAAGSPGKALYHFEAVAAVDPRFRDVTQNVQRLAKLGPKEEDPLPGATPPAVASGARGAAPSRGSASAAKPGHKAGKVGYV